jgi:hypothetical protein
MNVYQQTYTQQFIDDLPVNFNKVKNMDLSILPTKYHGLFTTDWNWGKYSKMAMETRIMYHELNNEYHHTDVLSRLDDKITKDEVITLGFPKD